MKLYTLLLIAFTTLPGVASFAEDELQAEALLERARKLSDIRSPNAPAFRLKATFTAITEHLDTVEGTYTEIWVSNKQWRREIVVGDSQHIEIGGATKRWLLNSATQVPSDAQRFPSILELTPSWLGEMKFEPGTDRDVNGTAIRCVVSTAGKMGEKHALCVYKSLGLMAERDTPRKIRRGFVDYSCQYGDYQKFGEYFFPRALVCLQDGHRKLDGKIIELSLDPSPNPALFAPLAGAIEIGNCTGHSLPPRPVSTTDPTFPSGSRDRSSSVDLWMIVDTKGKPQNIEVSRSGGKSFDQQALGTVRTWRFKPGTCDGEPIAMPINVEVDFRLSQ